jgi:hypothetical protein
MSLALIIVTTLYFLCSITLTLMLPYTLISPDAAFSQVLLASVRCMLDTVHACTALHATSSISQPADGSQRLGCGRRHLLTSG